MELEALDDVEVRDTETPDNLEGFKTPTIGMYFDTIEEARNYYERYGQENGFWIRTRGSDKGRNRSNEVTRVRFVCTKEENYATKKQQEGVQPLNVDAVDEEEKVISKKRVRNCSTVKCGCKAYLRIMHDKWNCKWKVTGFDENHNHPLVTSSKRIKMKSNRNMPKAVKDLTETFQKENIDISKIPSIFGGEYIGSDNRDCYNHLRNAEKMYTRNVFNKFKDEWSKVFHYKVENVRNGDGFQSFIVKSKDDELEKFEVTLDSQTYEDIDEIPEHFILPRWRQKANKFRIIDSQGLVHDDGKEESEALRLSPMCQEATKLACLPAPSNEAYKIFIEGMNDLFEKIQEVSKVSPIEICAEKDIEKSTEPSPSQMLLLDLNISICKGRKKDVKRKAATTQSKRLKSGIEMSLNKKKRKCHLCFQFGHDKRTCPSNPMSKTNKEEAKGSDSDQEEESDCSE
ncbi:hypothetical protein RHGRI_011187 [Rhododendron griersonianum]|uniref:Protein FAR1-RELATED SEQUENCE n=1 Tax=Rhododendron griersonianum TaxID=479676 RepID=A0AAV6KKV4_9ERIC|nr:hypothetical protein RHGRI_011187 [Rhododendron griersonianum]